MDKNKKNHLKKSDKSKDKNIIQKISNIDSNILSILKQNWDKIESEYDSIIKKLEKFEGKLKEQEIKKDYKSLITFFSNFKNNFKNIFFNVGINIANISTTDTEKINLSYDNIYNEMENLETVIKDINNMHNKKKLNKKLKIQNLESKLHEYMDEVENFDFDNILILIYKLKLNMDKKKENHLLNYVTGYKIPKNESKIEDKHVIIPLPKKTKEKKSEKNKPEKTKKVFKRIEDKKESKKKPNLKNTKAINYDELIKKMENTNKLLTDQIKRKDKNINIYRKKFNDQQNIIKNLELILSELEDQSKNKNKTSSNTQKNNKQINDIDLINDILVNDFENQDLNDSFEDYILYDDKFQEQMAINAVDQQIIDELYPNPDSMSYEQLLQLEDNMGNVNKGLSKKQYDKLPFVKYDKDKYSENYQCIICMEEFEKNENVKLLPCGHIFHDNCIKEWLLKQKSCPFCKSEIG